MERLRKFRRESSLLEMDRNKTADRPVERIWFATPEAEMKYKKIVRMMQQNGQKYRRTKSSMQIPSKDTGDYYDDDENSLLSSKKRKNSSENSAEPSKKKTRLVVGKERFEDPFIASLGPIPGENSDLFANMSFVLCYAEENLTKTRENNEDENDSRDQPFYSEQRLIVQLNAGGGKVYENFKLVPLEEHKRTKLITNTPNLHPQSVLCFNAGIPAYSYQWVIKCCRQNRPLDPSRDEIFLLNKELKSTRSSKGYLRRNRICAESPF